ncbi:MAG: hypothetical protein HUU60_08360 [Armatimonadetes bacterium]|nr:hypothetical protein [Armatimonadota bacterium]
MTATEGIARQDALEWSVWLAKGERLKLAVVCLALFVGPLCGFLFFNSPLMAIAAFWMLLSASADFLFPMRFKISDESVRARAGLSMREIRFDKVKRIDWGRAGAMLSPLANPSRLDAFRGVFLYYGDCESEIRERLGQVEIGDPSLALSEAL